MMDLLKEFPEVTAVDEEGYKSIVQLCPWLYKSEPETIALAFALSQRRSVQRRKRKKMFYWEVADAVTAKTGIKFRYLKERGAGRDVDVLFIGDDPEREYRNQLIGPFGLDDNDDLRVFLNYRTLDGIATVQILVQDCDDGAFLNSNVEVLPEALRGMVYL